MQKTSAHTTSHDLLRLQSFVQSCSCLSACPLLHSRLPNSAKHSLSRFWTRRTGSPYLIKFFKSLVTSFLRLNTTGGGYPPNSLTTAKIPSNRPANIPLHTFSNSPRNFRRESSSPSSEDELNEKAPQLGSHRVSEESDTAAGSDEFDLWSGSETGDLVDQFADDEDPLGGGGRPSADGEDIGLTSRKRGRRQKRVRYQVDEKATLAAKEGLSGRGGVPKKASEIPVPEPESKNISKGELALALIMAPTDSKARIHGLYGKKLM